MVYIGIDPGLDGAVCAMDGSQVQFHDAPTCKRIKRDYIPAEMLRILEPWKSGTAVIEAVSGRPGQGAASARSIGYGQGLWIGILAALRIPYEIVQPAVWKRKFGLIGADKKASVAIALQRFPCAADCLKRAKDHNRADALLLALWLSEKLK